MQVAVAQTYDAWIETSGALAFLDQVLGGWPAEEACEGWVVWDFDDDFFFCESHFES
jgi:hypothetical protein